MNGIHQGGRVGKRERKALSSGCLPLCSCCISWTQALVLLLGDKPGVHFNPLLAGVVCLWQPGLAAARLVSQGKHPDLPPCWLCCPFWHAGTDHRPRGGLQCSLHLLVQPIINITLLPPPGFCGQRVRALLKKAGSLDPVSERNHSQAVAYQ